MKKKKMKAEPIISTKDTRFRSILTSYLRRFSKFWHPIKLVKDRARIARGMYQCTTCSKIVGPKDIKIDHIEPVVAITGFTNWEDLVNRLFCEENGLQAICSVCHEIKTKEENRQRKSWKKEKAVLSYYKRKDEKNSE